MKFTSLIYPAPNPPSYNCDKLIGELLYVPKDFKVYLKSRTDTRIDSEARKWPAEYRKKRRQ